MAPKLTPTFQDEKKLHIVPAHEPLSDEQFSLQKAREVATKTRIEENKKAFGAKEAEIELGKVVGEEKKQEQKGNGHAALAADAPLKVAIIGTAPSSRMLAPYHDPTWQIWACSPGNMGVLPRADRWFEIHINLHLEENASYGRPYLNWLKTLKIPVYAQALYAKPDGELPNATIYPKDEMVKEFGKYFFTSSFSWMIALAIKEGAKEIALFGVDMASRDEYILQRPGGYFFITECARRGIKIGAPSESDILQPPPLYGFWEATPFGRKLLIREKELKDRVTDMRRQRDGLVQSITYLEGAIEDLDYIKNIWGGAQE